MTGTVVRFEARKLAAQYRARLVLLGALVVPVPVALIIHGQSQPPRDTLFGRYATSNGFSLALMILGFSGQWLLPVVAAIVAGDIFASEDQHGTWKTVLTRSAGRSRIFWSKVGVAALFNSVAVVLISVSTVAASVLIGGRSELIGVSGQSIPPTRALTLVSLCWLTSIIPTLGFTCLAIAISIATRNAAAGVAAPAVLGLLMQLVGSVSGVAGLRRVLLSTPFDAWHGLLAAPRFTGPLLDGLVVSIVWIAGSLACAFVMFRRRDITGG